MPIETLFQYILGVTLILICAYTILHEQELIRFERKAARYIKAFFKALYYTIKERGAK